ncbi:GTPase domain-containing protein [Paraburkholderia sp. HD33-4]|uniref:GTPase domain-containing protein n=1 Tax=Paraburkholderia sp. HD33-4 TaxID=2883242 RepID=UPI001F22BC03|nr:GTPase domain-containing protein [Paraburkholderia sp. HD33-4]
MSGIGVAEAKVAVDFLKLAKKEGWLDQALSAFKHKHNILVLGSTGVGKTNFLQSLTTLTPAAIDHMNRTEFAQKHKIKIAKEPFIFLDTPGELGKAPLRKKAIREAMAKKITGVINVVAYGYHEHRTPEKDVVNDQGIVDEAYLDAHRKLEVSALAEWVELLGDREQIDWAITIVTKADLWWHKKEEVFSHYQSGDYYQRLGSLSAMAPAVVEYSSVFHKFYGEGRLSGEFDDKNRERARGQLLNTLLQSVGKGSLNG